MRYHFKTGQREPNAGHNRYSSHVRFAQTFLARYIELRYTERTCAEGTATQGCDRSADQVLEWRGDVESPYILAGKR
jgi:hypothetical protein